METVTGLGSYPVRVLTLPVYEAGRVGRLMQVGMSLESLTTRHHFLLIMAGCSPGITTGGAAAGGCWPGRLWPR